jgi:hypothetical protein
MDRRRRDRAGFEAEEGRHRSSICTAWDDQADDIYSPTWKIYAVQIRQAGLRRVDAIFVEK